MSIFGLLPEEKPSSMAKPETPLRHPISKQQIRIEALRAAAQITNALVTMPGDLRGTQSIEEMTIMAAERFAQWLETGE